MRKIRKGDNVVVVTGKDKGKRGAVLRVLGDDYVLVEGANRVKKHQKPNPMKGTTGGIIDKEMPIHVSNVGVVCSSCNRPVRVGYRFTDGKKIRVCRKCGADV